MKNRIIKIIPFLIFIFTIWGCHIPTIITKKVNNDMPQTYGKNTDTSNISFITWRNYFADDNLNALIDTALHHNQELKIILQELEINKNEIQIRKGEYLPFLNITAGNGVERTPKYTRMGALESDLELRNEKAIPKPLQDYNALLNMTWELDVWRKLRKAKKAAVLRYMANTEGRQFVITKLVSEIASSYYELIALDNMLQIVEKNMEIQSSALNTVKLQKEAAKQTQLAVNRFEAQLLNTQNLQYNLKQQIVAVENKIYFLTGKFPTEIKRNIDGLSLTNKLSIAEGIPSQLLTQRPDIKKATLDIEAAGLDIEVAKAQFLPSFTIRSGIGFQSFNPVYLLNPKSILFNLIGDMVAPIINRNAIIAAYKTAGAKQIQSVCNYEQQVLYAYVEVLNQLEKINNFSKSVETKSKEVEILMQSIGIANSLFKYARADYTEVLLTQREAIDAKMELVEVQLQLMLSKINLYKALGGGWQ